MKRVITVCALISFLILLGMAGEKASVQKVPTLTSDAKKTGVHKHSVKQKTVFDTTVHNRALERAPETELEISEPYVEIKNEILRLDKELNSTTDLREAEQIRIRLDEIRALLPELPADTAAADRDQPDSGVLEASALSDQGLTDELTSVMAPLSVASRTSIQQPEARSIESEGVRTVDATQLTMELDVLCADAKHKQMQGEDIQEAEIRIDRLVRELRGMGKDVDDAGVLIEGSNPVTYAGGYGRNLIDENDPEVIEFRDLIRLRKETEIAGGDPTEFDARIAELSERVRPAPLDQMGENCADPLPLDVPSVNFGTTAAFADDYDEACPYTGSTSPDVVYEFNPPATTDYTFSLCRSGYDTKIYIYACGCSGAPIACNDDHDPCPGSLGAYRSLLECVSMNSSTTYYVVVDGYSGEFGDYVLEVGYCTPCTAPCPPGGISECTETPDTSHAMQDCNGGCEGRMVGVEQSYDAISCGETVCGETFTYVRGTDLLRDYDLYLFTLATTSLVSFECHTEAMVWLVVRDTSTCDLVGGFTYTSCSGGVEYCLDPGTYTLEVATAPSMGYPLPAPYYVTMSCGVCPEGAGCNDPIPIVNEVLLLNQTTAGMGTNCGNTCMYPYDRGNEIFYEWTVTQEGDYSIWLSPYASPNTGVLLDDNCPPDAYPYGTCIAYSTNSVAEPHGIVSEHLVPGTYYVMVDWNGYTGCIDHFDLGFSRMHECVTCEPSDMLECAEVPDSSHARLDCNGGCNNSSYGGVNSYQLIDLGQSVCGQCFTYQRGSLHRDLDWYQFSLGANYTIQVVLRPEFSGYVALYSGGCPVPTQLAVEYVESCTIGSITIGALGAGDYLLIVGPNFYPEIPAPQQYRLTLNAVGHDCGFAYTFADEATLIGQSTCGMGNDYDATCLSTYDEAEDMMFRWINNQDDEYTIQLNGHTSSQFGIAIDDECPPCVTGPPITMYTRFTPGIISLPPLRMAPGSYYMMVSGVTGCIPQFDLSVTREYTVGRDCGIPLEITDDDSLIGLTTCGFNDDYDNTCLGNHDEGEDVIIQWTVTEWDTFRLHIESYGTTFVGLVVDDNCPPDPSDCIAYSTLRTIHCLELGPGDYTIMVDTWPSPTCIPRFDLIISRQTAPPNLSCETAILMSAPPAAVTGNTDHCGPPITAPECPDAVTNQGLWYRIVGNGHTYTATTCHGTTDFDTKLSVYTCGCDGLTCVAGNDDDNTCGFGVLHSTVSWCTQPGVDYYILVHGYGSGAGVGNFNLSVEENLTPCDPDVCCPDDELTAPGSIVGYTAGAGNTCAARGSEDQTVLVHLPSAGEWTFSLCGSDYDTYLKIGTTCCSDNLCANDDTDCGDGITSESECACLNLAAGDYYVTIEGSLPGDAGAWILTVEEDFPPGQVEGVLADDNGCGEILTVWSDRDDETGYVVYRDGAFIDQTAANDTDYVDVLAPGTYSYAIRAINNCGSAALSDPDDGTLYDPPTQVSGVSASDDHCNEVLVSWSDVPDEMGYRVLRDDVQIGGDLAADVTSVTDSEAIPGIDHTYTVLAFNVHCESEVSDPDLGFAETHPPQVAGVTATDGECQITVSWTDLNQNESEYFILRDAVAVDTVDGDETSWVDSSANRSTVYAYSVTALNECGPGPVSDQNNGFRIGEPLAPTGLTASDTLCTGILLTWSDNASDEEGYVIIRGGLPLDTVAADGSTYLDSTVTEWEYTAYEVYAYNLCGDSDVSSDTGIRLPETEQVTGVSASDEEYCDVVEVTWNDAQHADGYIVYRDGAYADSIAGARLQGWSDFSASPGVVHSYAVAAYNECGTADTTDSDEGSLAMVPDAATGLTATTEDCDQVDLNWNDLTDETLYAIYRNGDQINTVPANTIAYTDTPEPGSYVYRVSGMNQCGEGAHSDSAVGTRMTVPDQVVGVTTTADCDSIYVSWLAVATADSYQVSVDGIAELRVGDTTASFGFTDTGTHWFSILSLNHCGWGEMSNTIPDSLWSLPTSPEILSAGTDHCEYVEITWIDHSDNESGFLVSRSDAQVDTTDADVESFQDTAAVPGVSYDYVVAAFNTCGDSDPSDEVTGSRRDVPAPVPDFAGEQFCGVVSLEWSDIENEEGYVIYRDDVAIDTVATDVTEYEDAPDPAAVYVYNVAALNACGEGAWSDDCNVTIDAPLAQVQNVVASDDDCQEIIVTWDDVLGELAYWLYRDGSETPIDSTGADQTIYTDHPEPGTHLYTVAARDECGLAPESDPSTGVRRDVPAPVPDCAASDTSCTSIHLAWTDVDEEHGYIIYRDGSWTPIDSLPPNTIAYEDDQADPGEHDYVVYSYNDCGIGGMIGDPVTGTRLEIPASVENFTAPAMNCTQVALTWDDLPNEDGYHIYRDGVPEPLVVLGADETGYNDDAPPGSYSYSILGFNQCGLGPATDPPITATVIELPGQVDNVAASDDRCREVWVTWDAATGEVDGYEIFDEIGSIGDVGAGVTEFLAQGCEPDTHTFTVVALNDLCGSGPVSDPAEGICHGNAGVPTNVTATTDHCDSVVVGWTAATGEVDEYRIYRDGSEIGTAQVEEYVDTSVDDAAEHEYTVRAHNESCGVDSSSESAAGQARKLALFSQILPDTVRCGEFLNAHLSHCSGVDVDSVFISVAGGAYVFVTAFAPPQDQIDVQVPPMDSLYTTDNRVRIISARGARRDTLETPPFVIECPEAASSSSPGLPEDFYLSQNYPNPFNPSTTFSFGLPRESVISISVYDILGRRVSDLVAGTMPAGHHHVIWDCAHCASGIYLITMTGSDFTIVRKAMFLR